MPQVTDADFELYLARFMAYLVCGMTRTNGLTILEASDFRLISTPQGQMLLALINKECPQAIESSRYVLWSRGMTELEGLHVGVGSESDDPGQIVGRTWTPREGYIVDT